MAKFEEEKVINALHPEKAEVGKKYWYSDNLKLLKKHVEENDSECVGNLKSIEDGENFCCFQIDNKCSWELLYPYEEPPRQRMTNIQLMEWLSKGNGVYKGSGDYAISDFTIEVELFNEEVDKTFLICPFGQTEWIEPTVDVYERDCKGGKE